MFPDKFIEDGIYEILSQTLPKQNDFFESDYSEEPQELLYFRINTKLLLLDLVVEHRNEVLEIDESELDDFHIKYYSEEYEKDYVELRAKNKFWFAHPALLRIVLELEFGQKCKEFADIGDKT